MYATEVGNDQKKQIVWVQRALFSISEQHPQSLKHKNTTINTTEQRDKHWHIFLNYCTSLHVELLRILYIFTC